jgi:hypothetical protein
MRKLILTLVAVLAMPCLVALFSGVATADVDMYAPGGLSTTNPLGPSATVTPATTYGAESYYCADPWITVGSNESAGGPPLTQPLARRPHFAKRVTSGLISRQ